MDEPSAFASVTAGVMSRHPEGSRVRAILTGMLDARQANERRRQAVLSHPDLRDRLTGPLVGFQRASDWNGYIPPRVLLDDDDELCRSERAGLVRRNQLGHRSCGTRLNNSARRLELLEISAEAHRRAQE